MGIKSRQKAEYLIWYFMDTDRIENNFDRQYSAKENAIKHVDELIRIMMDNNMDYSFYREVKELGDQSHLPPSVL